MKAVSGVAAKKGSLFEKCILFELLKNNIMFSSYQQDEASKFDLTVVKRHDRRV
ncbi:hypothetical protein CHCC20331_4029 [Bacillus paralicheniformis]|nr:hypothetical protein CHCC20372_1696 [Bacillus paralicheniformis]TWK81556.1 hypothetical protein CHCC20331_4029 [Bacillus paralicheniformis]